LTQNALAVHESTYDRLYHLCQTITRAVDVRQAGLELDIDLPLHRYINDPSQLDEWIKQHSA
ncbi:hypothetical protein BKA66DRAFT_394738, partial [Pyrenochaeta sp. MPI-SDFR-AT-0127]